MTKNNDMKNGQFIEMELILRLLEVKNDTDL